MPQWVIFPSIIFPITSNYCRNSQIQINNANTKIAFLLCLFLQKWPAAQFKTYEVYTQVNKWHFIDFLKATGSSTTSSSLGRLFQAEGLAHEKLCLPNLTAVRGIHHNLWWQNENVVVNIADRHRQWSGGERLNYALCKLDAWEYTICRLYGRPIWQKTNEVVVKMRSHGDPEIGDVLVNE